MEGLDARGRSATIRGEVSEDETNDEIGDELVAAIDEKWARWKRPLIGAAVFVGLLVLYVFVYPVLFWFVEIADLPDWFYDGMEKTVIPLMWMDENFSPYSFYIEWLGGKLDA